MASLTVTHTFVPGTSADAAEANTNFQDIVTWSQGNVQEDNLGTFSGALTWSISTGVVAMSVANSGDQGSLELTQSAALNPNRSGVKLSHTAAETAGDAGLFVDFTNASSTVPLVKAKANSASPLFEGEQQGSGVFLRFKNASDTFFELSENSGVVTYETFNGDTHRFAQDGTARLDVASSLIFNDTAGTKLFEVSTSSLLFNNSSGTKLFEVTDGTLTVLESGGNSFSVDASAVDTATMVVKDTIRFASDTGPIVQGQSGWVFASALLLRDINGAETAPGPRMRGITDSVIEVRGDGASNVTKGKMMLSGTSMSGGTKIVTGTTTADGGGNISVSFGGDDFTVAPLIFGQGQASGTSFANITPSTTGFTAQGAASATYTWAAVGRYA